jgi:multicomponent Na+:H+ antiporter subunit F
MLPNNILSGFLLLCCILLAFTAIASLIRAIRGPRFTDRLMAVNMIGTMVIAMMCILSVYLKQSFLIDVAIVYALLSALSVFVLARLVIVRRYGQIEREKSTPILEEGSVTNAESNH